MRTDETVLIKQEPTEGTEMPIYQSTGCLTGTVSDVAAAQNYLLRDDMTKYLDPPLSEAIERIQWNLYSNGHDYVVEAIASRELSPDELKQLATWVSGQNSDGLGEGFEQQDFAELYYGDFEDEDWEMVSFDWQTNDSTFTRVV